MNPMLLMAAGGGVGAIGGVISGIMGSSSAKKAAVAAFGQLDLAQYTTKATTDYLKTLFAPYVEAGTNALSILQNRIQTSTERDVESKRKVFALEQRIKDLSRPVSYGADVPLPVGRGATQRREALFVQMEADRRRKLREAQSELALLKREQAELSPLFAKQDQEYNERFTRISSTLDQIAKVSNLPNTLAGIREELQNDPVYQFRLAEGERAINRAAAAKGLSRSGNAIEELSNFSLALTGEETDKYVDRQLKSLSAAVTGLGAMLGEQSQGVQQAVSLATLGLSGAQTEAQTITTQSGTQAGLATSAANVAMQTELAKGQAIQSAIGNVTGTIGGLSALSLLTQPKADVSSASSGYSMSSGALTPAQRAFPTGSFLGKAF